MTVTRRTRTRPAGSLITSKLTGIIRHRRQAPAPDEAPTVAEETRQTGPGPVIAMQGEENVLTQILNQARRTVRAPRTGNHIHVSDLLSRCVRKKAIVELEQVRLPLSSLSLMESITYAQGDAIHDVIRSRATQGSPESVWGIWRCRCGSARTEEPCTFSSVPQDLSCAKCEGYLDVYEEVSMLDHEYDIVGHPDLILYLAALSTFYVTELKSIAHDRFTTLARPDPDHVLQVVFYWWLMHRLGYPLADHVTILYVTKGYTFRDSPFKEFVVRVADVLPRLNSYIEEARSIKVARETGVLPPRTKCQARTSTDARKCEVVESCFGENNAKPVYITYSDAIRTRKA